ncbi:MAG: poly(A) polymerase [Nitrospirae bacterium]|nr:poly(A) polymerase [Nitrospirota bacterium]
MSPIKPTIIPRSKHAISRDWISRNAVRVLYKLKEHGYFAYLVGGGVRDLLLGREPKDFDIATNATPGELKKTFRNCRLIGRRFRLAHVHFHDEIIEVATFRSMVSDEPVEGEVALHPEQPQVIQSSVSDQSEGNIPLPMISSASLRQGSGQASVVKDSGIVTSGTQTTVPVRPKPPRMLKTEGGMILRDNVFGTPEEDALRRDFTVNAMFYNIADFSVIDYVGGMQDLERGLIRIIGDPLVRFTEDPVRMVRAVRFAALLGFEIEEKTYRAMLELKDHVALASPSRMYEEVLKLFLLGEGEKTYQLLRKTGLFGVIFPRLNEWVDTESDGFPHVWIGKAFEWVDACVQAGRQIPPHILFALMFGQVIEGKAAELRRQGAPALDAMTKAVTGIMLEQTQRVQIPKKIGLSMRDMYWDQQRFEKREGKYPRYFLRRPGFVDAFEYFRFTSETTSEHKELRAWWKEFIKTNPLSKDEKKEILISAEKKAKPTRRRRRRGGKPRTEAPKPKT